MSPEETAEHVWKLPITERLSILTMSIIERDHECVAAASAVARMAEYLCQGLSPEARFKIASLMRDQADRLERPLLVAS